MPSIYRGRSLAWVRETLGKKQPRAISAFSFANRYKDELVPDVADFQPGMVVFWGTREPGDCGIYVGDGLVRCLNNYGDPVVRSLSAVAPNVVIGAMFWPADSAKRVGVRDGTS